MKRLTLIRHARAAPGGDGVSDFDRALDGRGMSDSAAVAERLREAGFSPDLIVASPATRALVTAERIAGRIGYPVASIRHDPRIFEASAERLLSLVQELDDACAHGALVGHNPGLLDLAGILSADPIESLPPGGVVDLEIDADHWLETEARTARLVRRLNPD